MIQTPADGTLRHEIFTTKWGIFSLITSQLRAGEIHTAATPRRAVSLQKIATNLQKEFDSRSWHSYPEDRYRTFSVLYLRPVATRLVGACFQYDRVARRVLLLLLIQASLSNDRAGVTDSYEETGKSEIIPGLVAHDNRLDGVRGEVPLLSRVPS
jgi:hypothetical protein